MKTILFPGWAMPPVKNIYEEFIPNLMSTFDIVDYGFFEPRHKFDFKNPDSEIAKFADKEYDFVIGYSLGSQFALRLALLSNTQPKALIIISGFAKFAESKDNPFGQNNFALNAMITGMKIQPAKVLREFYKVSFGHLKKNIIDEKYIPVPSAMAEALRFLLDCDFRSNLKKINCPTLVIAGEQDTVVKPSLSEELAKSIVNAEFKLERGSGHALPFSKSEEIKNIINEFLIKKNII